MGNNHSSSHIRTTSAPKVIMSARAGGVEHGLISDIVSPRDLAMFRDKTFTNRNFSRGLDTPSNIRYNQNQLDWEMVSQTDENLRPTRKNQTTATHVTHSTQQADNFKQRFRTHTAATFDDTKARLAGMHNRRLSRRVSQKFDEVPSPMLFLEDKKKVFSQDGDTHEFEFSGTSNQPESSTPQVLYDSQYEEIPDENMTPQMIFTATIANITRKYGKYVEDGGMLDDSWKANTNIHHFIHTREVYQGQWVDGKRHGRGDQSWADGSVYQGNWANDKRNGRGRYISSDGSVYEGQWRHNMFHGNGKCVYANGKKYDGGWYENMKHGTGIEVFLDGSKYVGKYRVGVRTGKGKQTWPDGSIYTGEFSQDMMHGYGAMKWSDGRRYVGEWSENMMHGKGVFTWKDGKRYTGEYVENMKSGNGEFDWPDGSKYKGPFLDNKMHGEGSYSTKGDQMKKGIWEKGEAVQWL